jgi:hypothetical protein
MAIKAGGNAAGHRSSRSTPSLKKADETATVRGILEKWNAFTEPWRGNFVRYLDGDPMNPAPSNVVCVSPRDAFAHLDDWTVNWPQCLDPAEVQFVLDNTAKFARVFA